MKTLELARYYREASMDPVVASYYTAKTNAIIEKYGPGPRVHFHVGYFDPPAPPPEASSLLDLRRGLVQAQERLIAVAVEHWRAVTELGHRVLDAGCGLGGTSLWWAEKLGCEVTALTCVAEHARFVAQRAADTGLARVRACVADAHDFHDHSPYDTAMAWEAACYFDRARWFAGLRRSLVPRGRVFIEDAFVTNPASWKAVFDDHWHTDITSVKEYQRAGSASGFRLADDLDITAHTSEFWDWSVAWNERRSQLPEADLPRLRASSAAHRQMRAAWDCAGIHIRLLVFERER